jgi:hypothetical protein
MLNTEGRNKFSVAEQKLFYKLGYTPEFLDALEVFPAYRVAATEAFSLNKRGPEIEALRRAFFALHNQFPAMLRMTEEFEKLLQY